MIMVHIPMICVWQRHERKMQSRRYQPRTELVKSAQQPSTKRNFHNLILRASSVNRLEPTVIWKVQLRHTWLFIPLFRDCQLRWITKQGSETPVLNIGNGEWNPQLLAVIPFPHPLQVDPKLILSLESKKSSQKTSFSSLKMQLFWHQVPHFWKTP